jgi:large subunit ribosomal protein L29
MTKVSELRELGLEALRQRERDLEDEIFQMRIKKSMEQLDSPVKLREVRRGLARVKTLLREQEEQA